MTEKFIMSDYYREKFEAAMEYQDFVSDILREKLGIFVGAYSSKKYQYEKGESQAGIEIKHDMLLHNTGNLFIETAEKRDADNQNWIPSGIYRNDNGWLYLIGDYNKIFIFSKFQLRKIVENKKLIESHNMKFVTIGRQTSQGYILPVVKALESGACLKHLIIEGANKNA